MFNNSPGCSLFLQYTPELVYSWTVDPMIRALVTNRMDKNVWGSRFFKLEMYKRIYPEIIDREKLHGFENYPGGYYGLMKRNAEIQSPVSKNNPPWYCDICHDRYVDFIKFMKGSK